MEMTTNEIINKYNDTGTLTESQVSTILENYRSEAINNLKQVPNRKFALYLLDTVIEYRKKEDYEIGTGDNLMFASYLLGLHNQVEDSLLIWNAKRTDFDSFCYVDIQLVVFAGIKKTLNYLKTIGTDEATKAIDYLKRCQSAGDFEDLETYFSSQHLPWWV